MSVTDNSGKSRLKSLWDDRIMADFRDFRFTWSGFFRWTGITLLAVLIAAIVTLYFLDWNQMRGPIGRYLSHRTGREVRIDGNLSVKLFTLQPSIDAGGLYIGNPGWVGKPQAAKVKEFRVELRLLPLIFGELILPLVKIDQPDLLVVRDPDGRTNWDSKSGQNPNEALKLPPIRRFIVNNGHVVIDDAVRKLHFTGSVSSTEEQGGFSKKKGGAAFTLTGDGTLNANKFLADVRGGPLLNVDETRPYNFKADIHSGDTHVLVEGAITQPFHLDNVTAGLAITGPNLSDLYYLTGLTLPGTPAYHLTVNVVREGSQYRLNDLNGVLGNSDLHGSLTVDASNRIPALAGRVASRALDFKDLGAVIRGGKKAEQSKFLIPDMVLHTERLRQMNAEVDYSAQSIKSQDFPLRGLDTHISLQGGVLNLKPLAFAFTQGKLAGSVKIDARKEVPVSSVDARITDIHAESFIKGGDKPITGLVEARAVL
ncbi:MAG TPA: AsmA family protein, partial [Rhizomicrobium sp.]